MRIRKGAIGLRHNGVHLRLVQSATGLPVDLFVHVIRLRSQRTPRNEIHCAHRARIWRSASTTTTVDKVFRRVLVVTCEIGENGCLLGELPDNLLQQIGLACTELLPLGLNLG